MSDSKLTILIVDDIPENIAVLIGLLSKQYKVKASTNGSEGLELAFKKPPDLILLDIMMPEMDGYEVCTRLKGNPTTQKIPIIFLTAKAEAADVVKGLRLGAADYVTKPFEPQELLARVNNVVELTQHRLQLESLIEEKTTELVHAQKLQDAAKSSATIQACIEHLQLSISSQTKFIRQVMNYFNGCYNNICKAHQLDVNIFGICINEAVTNAVVHGNLEVPSSLKQEDWKKFEDLVDEREADPEYENKKVTIAYHVDESQIKIEMEDEGNGFDPSNLPNPNDPEAMLASGRGILLIRSFMDEVSWNEKGNKITMIKKLGIM
ncbi:MAG: response regulator [SAR324 cluster bacterium]|nr:response regulator [SAR324 cluster bacterium]